MFKKLRQLSLGHTGKLLGMAFMSTIFLVGCGANNNSASENQEAAINAGDPITVSTMNDTEGEVLGRMMVLALENAGYEVTDNTFGYTGTVNGRTALLEGETDIYMDYTGRGLRLIEGVDPVLFQEIDSAYQTVSEWDEKNNELIWLQPAPFNNTDALATRRDVAEKYDLKTMEDFAKYVNEGGDVNMIAYAYWIELASGLPGMEEAYGFKLKEDQYTAVEGNNEQLLGEGQNGINFGHVYSSSGLVPEYDLVVLEDTKHVSPVYSPSPIIRKDSLEKFPGVPEVLEPVFESITLEEMVEMNRRVQVDGEAGMDVAREYLESKGFIE